MSKKILLVYGLQNYLLLHRVILASRTDYEVLTASSGQEAAYLAITHTPDLILMDEMMLFKAGTNVCYGLGKNASTAHIPVVLLVPADSLINQERGRNCGCNQFATRPENADALLSLVHMYLENSLSPGTQVLPDAPKIKAD
jgi:DNA-binding response OmpR family regulator